MCNWPVQISPPLSSQVFKTGVTHYFSIEKARQQLGYDPQPRTLDGVVEWFKDRGHGRRVQPEKEQSAVKTFLLRLILLLTVFTVVMSFLPVAM